MIMKKLSVLMFALLLATVACNNNPDGDESKVSFGIYETVTDSLSAIVAYAHVDSAFTMTVPADNQVKYLRTATPVDPEGHYYAIVAVKAQPVITGSDLKTAKPDKDVVEIRLNLKGARKWAEMTRNNIGKTVAITIDDRVYALPTVMAEIKEGRAMISGLENEDTALKISEALNGR